MCIYILLAVKINIGNKIIDINIIRWRSLLIVLFYVRCIFFLYPMTTSLSLYDPLSLSPVDGCKKPQSHIRSSLFQPFWHFSFDFRARTARDRKSALRLKSCTDTMRQAARVGQRGRFPTPGSPGAIRLRNRKYKLSEGGVKGRVL